MLEMLTAAGSSSSGPPAQKWYTGQEIIAYDSYNFKSAGFTDYTGKSVSCGSRVLGRDGSLPTYFNDNSFKYGKGILMNLNSSIFVNNDSSGITASTFTSAWTLDFWVRTDTTPGSSNDFANALYLVLYPSISTANTASRLLIAPDGSNNYRVSVWNNSSTRSYTSGTFFDPLKRPKWAHFAITYNGSNLIRFYINGAVVATGSVTILSSPSAAQFGIAGYQQEGSQKMIIERYRFRSGNYFPANGFDVNTIYDVSEPYAPGPTTLAKGDSSLGYYGEVSSADMIKGTDLAQYVGLGNSNIIYDTGNWLCYSLNGKRVYVAKKPIMNQVSWNTLNAQGLVTGSNIVVIHGIKYKVRLLTGVNSTAGEWNSLIYRVHVSDPTGSNWASFTNEDLVIGTGRGRTTWCQEDVSGAKVYRGYNSLTDYQTGQPTFATDTTGWRPILEPV